MSAARDIRRIAAAILASGVVLGAGALPAAADGHGGRDRSAVVIGDVQYDSPGRDDHSNRSLNAEWVEVKNHSRHAVKLRGFTLTDKQGNRYRFDRLRLKGHSSVKVHTGHGRDMRHHVYQDRRNYVWDNNDTATLRDARGRVLDRESWGRGHHHR
ncbi:lamin tail domain-containing protein [Streptomyces sp. NPDC057302]|uniref:lamin tail domain-containing protein n=1 Tax=Streptomyces sp. NPDC057302 TaxID=3346094 RepID=UPI003642FF3F